MKNKKKWILSEQCPQYKFWIPAGACPRMLLSGAGMAMKERI
jgi:hypothetical protein